MKQMLVIISLFLVSITVNAQSVPDATTVLKEAFQKAKVEKKNAQDKCIIHYSHIF